MAMPSAMPTKTMDLPKLPSFSVRAPMAAQAEFETRCPSYAGDADGEGRGEIAYGLGPVGAARDGGGLGRVVGRGYALAEEDHGGGEHDEEEAAEVGDERLFHALAGLGAAGDEPEGQNYEHEDGNEGLMSLISIVGTSDLSDVFIRRCQAARWAGEE